MRKIDTIDRVPRAGLLLVLILAGSFCLRAGAGVVTDVVLFGDSLSDMGNFHDVTDDNFFVPALPQSPPYFGGRFSNGPVWVEHVLAALQLPALVPSRNGGSNYAYGSAKTGSGSISYTFFSIPNVGNQVSQFTSSHTLRPDQLVVLWGGANDLIDNPSIDPAVPVANLAARITELHAVGGRQFFVPNLPPLGKTPRFVGGSSEAAMNALSANFNALLATELAALETSLGIAIQRFDVQQVFQRALSDPGAFGLTNVTGQALDGTIWGGTVVPNPGEYLFWDDLHPTAVAHAFLGAAAAKEFALHTNTSRTLALMQQWGTAEDLTGEFRVDGNLDVTGAWKWTGLLVKHGVGVLSLDLASGFTTGPNASLAIGDGTVHLAGDGRPFALAGLTFDAAGSTLSGTTVVTVNGTITNNAAAAAIDLPITLASAGGAIDGGTNSGNVLTISKPISGSVGLTKQGTGKVVLTQDTVYTGDTIVEAGTLVLQGLSNGDSTTVNGTLLADYIRQDTLTINTGGKVKSDGSGTSVVNFLNIADSLGNFSWGTGGGGSSDSMNVIAVPEPATWLLSIMAVLAGFLAWRRRK